MIDDLKPYPSMKNSGIAWLGEVPSHWVVKRLRNVSEMRVSNVDKHAKDDECAVRLCNYMDVYNYDRIRATLPFMRATATTDEIKRFRLRVGDVLITKDSESWNDIGVPALVENTEDDLICGYHLALLRPDIEQISGEFLYRVISSINLANQFYIRANGVTRFGLSHHAIKSVWLPLAPPPEQAAIVRFLDHADRRIQRYIRAKEKLIALLEEQKQAIVHQAVTGRIHVRTGQPYPAYKPSGVEWLGDVPAHWEIRKLGRCGKLLKGNGGNKEDEVPEGVPCIRYGDLYTTHTYFITESRSFISTEKAEEYTALQFGDVLFAASGETIAEIGKSAANLISSEACCGGDIILFRPKRKFDARYLGYITDCWAATSQKAVMGRGITVMHIYGTQLKYLMLPIPPVSEQGPIAQFLDASLAKIGDAIAGARREIELLHEYRTRLIADVVTGKLDVREAAVALPEADPLTEEDDTAFDCEEEPAKVAG